MTTAAELPRWRLDTIFPGVDSAELRDAVEEIRHGVEDLAKFMESAGVRGDGPAGDGAPSNSAAVLDELLVRFDRLLTAYSDVSAYLGARIDTDAFDDEVQAERSRLQPLASRLNVLVKRFSSWLGGLDLASLLDSTPRIAEHRYALERHAVLAERLMGDEAEELASVLDDSGGKAWGRLHSALIGRHTVTVDLPGRDTDEYNVAELKQLQYDEDREVRRAAYTAELDLLSRNELSFAAAMNSIKGQVGELARRRGWESALDESLFANAIDRPSLDAMQRAVRDSFPVFRRYMRAKARFLGRDRLAWYDLLAPVSAGPQQRFEWERAREFVIENFAGYSPGLAQYAERAFGEGWLDVPSQKGKTNGAYCVSVPGRKESRVLLNFGGKLDDVFTIAHELGHGFHNDCRFRYGRTALQHSTPMTLAETASIFCETIVVNAMLETANDAARLAILEQDLLGANQLVVDIDSRFRFEQAVFEGRRERELSVDEMKAAMLHAQAATYGDALEPELRHPLMWAHKGHYYSSTRSYYNYPYTFGLLFGLGLYRVYREQPEGFQDRYERLLASTGMADAASLGRDFGIDIQDTAFWQGSLSVFEERVKEFERLVGLSPG